MSMSQNDKGGGDHKSAKKVSRIILMALKYSPFKMITTVPTTLELIPTLTCKLL
jgi:hypothetical protein